MGKSRDPRLNLRKLSLGFQQSYTKLYGGFWTFVGLKTNIIFLEKKIIISFLLNHFFYDLHSTISTRDMKSSIMKFSLERRKGQKGEKRKKIISSQKRKRGKLKNLPFVEKFRKLFKKRFNQCEISSTATIKPLKRGRVNN